MASESGNETKAEECRVKANFQWGTMPQQELSGQFTRSMVDMRKPKPYKLANPPRSPKQSEMESACKAIEIPSCPITIHTIKLLKYIRQVRDLIAKLENKTRIVYSYGATIAELSHPPVFETEATTLRRSRSSSSGKSLDEEDKCVFSAPDSEFRSGLKTIDFPPLDDDTASRILKRSVAITAAHGGYEESTLSSLDVLTGVAEAFMISFSKSLRDTLDSEAEKGRTPFFDSLEQVLHESGISGLKDIGRFWQEKVVQRHKSLQTQAAKLAKTVQSLKYPKVPDISRQVKPENNQAFPKTYGKWTPVTGMSSSPFPAGQPINTMTGSSWTLQSVKPEKQDNGNYLFPGTSQQESLRVKSENEGFESSSTDLFDTDNSEDNFALDSFMQ